MACLLPFLEPSAKKDDKAEKNLLDSLCGDGSFGARGNFDTRHLT